VLQQVHELFAVDLLCHQVHAINVRWNIYLQHQTTVSGAFRWLAFEITVILNDFQ